MKKHSCFLMVVFLLFSVSTALLVACSGQTDYVASVKALKPYEDYGVSTTYGTVLNKYISSCKWQERVQSKDLAYVDASGKITDVDGSAYEIAITFRVTPYEGKTKGMLWIEPYIIEIDGSSYQGDIAESYIEDFFDAYEDGFDSIADFYNYYG